MKSLQGPLPVCHDLRLNRSLVQLSYIYIVNIQLKFNWRTQVFKLDVWTYFINKHTSGWCLATASSNPSTWCICEALPVVSLSNTVWNWPVMGAVLSGYIAVNVTVKYIQLKMYLIVWFITQSYKCIYHMGVTVLYNGVKDMKIWRDFITSADKVSYVNCNFQYI